MQHSHCGDLHRLSGLNGKILRYQSNDFYRRRGGDEDEEKYCEHSICHCRALKSARHKLLGKHCFAIHAELASEKIGNLVAFICHTKWI